MAKSRETTFEEREIIINLYKNGKSERNIAELCSKPRSTINSIIKKYKTSGTIFNKVRSGRPSKISDRLKTKIVRQIKINPKISAPKIAADIAGTDNVQVAPQTIRNVLKKHGYNGRVARKKCWVSKANKVKRLNFAIRHANKP